MNMFPLSACSGQFDIQGAFGNNNIILSELSSVEELPRIRLRRHGNLQRPAENYRLTLGAGIRGNILIAVDHLGGDISLGANTRLEINIRFWNRSSLFIGAGTTTNGARFVLDNSDIQIGADCMFSDEIVLQSSDQHGLIDLESMEITNNRRRKILLGEHVWVGRRSIIMPDVEIGAGSVIGAGSTVTRSVAPTSYAVGTPAKTIRSNASWTRSPHTTSLREDAFFARLRSAVSDT